MVQIKLEKGLPTKGGNLATWRYSVSFSFGVLKPRCQVSVLVWFHGCRNIDSSFDFSFAYAQLRLLGFSFGLVSSKKTILF